MPAPRRRDADAFAALESGLELDADDQPVRDIEAPTAERYDRIEPPHRSAETRVPLALAAFVVVACASLGAATATLVLHDRVMRITASWTASR